MSVTRERLIYLLTQATDRLDSALACASNELEREEWQEEADFIQALRAEIEEARK